MITDYSDLGTIAKIAYSRYASGGLTFAQVEALATAGKITIDEKQFILGE